MSILLALVLPASLTAQLPVSTRGVPAGAQHRPFVAARYLPELEADLTGGVLASGDLDGDGRLDLVVGETAPGFTFPRAMRSHLNDGEGHFVLEHTLPLDVALVSSGFQLANHVELADVTGDQVLDLLYERQDTFGRVGPSGVLVHPGDGSGGFGAALLIAPGGYLQGYGVGDSDGDGVQDVLVLGQEDGGDVTMRWWQYEGGAFAPAAPGLVITSPSPFRFVLADLDADGLEDVVATVYPAYDRLVLYRTEAGAPSVSGELLLPAAFQDVNHALRSGDLDGDGDEDVLLTRLGFPGADYHLLPLWNAGDGSLAGVPAAYAQPQGVIYGPGDLGDWDGDGDLDLVSGLFAWFENRDGVFVERGSVLNAYSSISAAGPRAWIHDYDGDGQADAVSSWCLFRGDSGFGGPVSQSLQEPYFSFSPSARLQDWDGDGDPDLVEPQQLNLNRGDGSFDSTTTYLPVGGTFFVITLIGVADYDGDGLEEAIVNVNEGFPTYQFLEMRLYERDHDGSWSIGSTIPFGVEITASAVTGVRPSADVDGDGDVDLLGPNGYWANQGSGVFDDFLTAAWSGLAIDAFDLDEDGAPEVLARLSGDLRLYWNQGGAAFVASVLRPFDPSLVTARLDVDEDGRLDLVTVVEGEDELWIHPRTAPQEIGAPVLLPLPGALAAPAAVSDVDGDGHADLVAQRRCEAGPTAISVFRRRAGLVFEERRDWISGPGTYRLLDLDADGDLDALGSTLFRNLRFDGAPAGGAYQYRRSGGIAGAGGFVPILGTPGPVRGGLEVPLSLARGSGGAAGWLVLGLGRGASTQPPFPVPVFLDTITSVVPVQLGGTPGLAGRGTLSTAWPAPLALAGETVNLQALLVDPAAPQGFATSNGLELRVGGPAGGSAGPRTRRQAGGGGVGRAPGGPAPRPAVSAARPRSPRWPRPAGRPAR